MVSVKNPELQFWSDGPQDQWEHGELPQDSFWDYVI
jgi:hypothetical protein